MIEVPLDPIFDAFGVAATVTPPGEDPVETTVVWVPQTPEERQVGVEIQESRRVLCLRRSDVPFVPDGTEIVAPDMAGGDPLTWVKDGLDREEADLWRVYVLRADPTEDSD